MINWRVFSIAFLTISAACTVDSIDSVSLARIESDVSFLAHDLLEGRGTPGRGLDIAALYLVNELKEVGWEPANEGAYYQPFEVGYFKPEPGGYRITLNGEVLDSEEYAFLPFGLDPESTPEHFGLTFAGHGLFAPEKNIDNFDDLDLSGKALVSLFGAPWEPHPQAPHAYDRLIGKSVHGTVRHAGCFIYVSHEFENPEDSEGSPELPFVQEMVNAPYAFVPDLGGMATMGMGPVLVLPPSVFDRILAEPSGRTYSEWQADLDTDFKALEIPGSLEIEIKLERKIGTSSNVVAKLIGTDRALKDEWIVMTAHYDHLGSKDVPPGTDGIWNGADDNASGTAALLEIARLLGSSNPQRSVLIIFTAGEDRGMLGSAYYAKHPLVPLKKTIININVDMVGRATGAVSGYSIGCPELLETVQGLGRSSGFPVVPEGDPALPVIYFLDSYHFAAADIPFIEFFTNIHEDYHQPSDEIDKINFEGLVEVTEVVALVTEYFLNGGVKPVFERPPWFLTP